MPHMKVFAHFALTYAQYGLFKRNLPVEERVVRAAYQAFLRRAPTSHELNTLSAAQRNGGLRPSGIASYMLQHNEYQQRFARVVEHAPATLASEAQPEPPPPPVELPLAQRYYQQVAARLVPNAADAAFLAQVYEVVLQRPIDRNGLAHFSYALERGLMGREDVITNLIASAEYCERMGLPIDPRIALHQMRMVLFSQLLPPAQRVLDLGGAAHNQPAGALLAMGYPHCPDEIVIVDLPPEARIGGVTAAEPVHVLTTEGGIRVSYLYRSMADLADLPTASFDLIVSGESIEHISPEDGVTVCREAFRLLKPGGAFCLDTPNGALTRLQSPDEFIHPEHQKEYLACEIHDLLRENGFEIVQAKAICPMPESLALQKFDLSELSRNRRISDRPEEGYVFFFHARKPTRHEN